MGAFARWQRRELRGKSGDWLGEPGRPRVGWQEGQGHPTLGPVWEVGSWKVMRDRGMPAVPGRERGFRLPAGRVEIKQPLGDRGAASSRDPLPGGWGIPAGGLWYLLKQGVLSLGVQPGRPNPALFRLLTGPRRKAPSGRARGLRSAGGVQGRAAVAALS